jgi:hypothetical protein
VNGRVAVVGNGVVRIIIVDLLGTVLFEGSLASEEETA